MVFAHYGDRHFRVGTCDPDRTVNRRTVKHVGTTRCERLVPLCLRLCCNAKLNSKMNGVSKPIMMTDFLKPT